MTDQIFFDTDCLCAFLWVGSENLIVRLYTSRIILPQQVYDEIRKVPHLQKKTDILLANKDIVLMSMSVGTPEADLYFKLTTNPDAGCKIIGKGEAAAISLAKHNDAILGSNNLKDIGSYVALYKLKHITTGDILVEALANGLITEDQGNNIWTNMLSKRRSLPTATFSDYLSFKTHQTP